MLLVCLSGAVSLARALKKYSYERAIRAHHGILLVVKPVHRSAPFFRVGGKRERPFRADRLRALPAVVTTDLHRIRLCELGGAYHDGIVRDAVRSLQQPERNRRRGIPHN